MYSVCVWSVVDGRRIAELESAQYQAALLNRMSDDDQWRLLEEALENMASGRQLREARGTRSIYHNNAIQAWKLDVNGELSNVQVG